VVRRRRAPEGLTRLGSALGLLAFACGAAPTPEAGAALALPAAAAGLYTFALPAGSAPLPAGLEAAEARHAAAAESYGAGDFAAAAEAFLDAARAALPEPASVYATELAGARTAACRNAALAFAAAGRPEAARDRARALRTDDPACADALEMLTPAP
jgi:hypothetical protein